MDIKYRISWTWIGGNSDKKYNVVKVVTENDKTTSIIRVKSLKTSKQAESYASKLNNELRGKL